MSTRKIDRREDINYEEDRKAVTEVEFADPTRKRFPIDTPSDIRASWHYINDPEMITDYDEEELFAVKSRIQSAAEEDGVKLSM